MVKLPERLTVVRVNDLLPFRGFIIHRKLRSIAVTMYGSYGDLATVELNPQVAQTLAQALLQACEVLVGQTTDLGADKGTEGP